MAHKKKKQRYAHLVEDVVWYFSDGTGTFAEVARRLGITPGAVRQWPRGKGGMVSPAIALRAAYRSEGALVLEPAVYDDWKISSAG